MSFNKVFSKLASDLKKPDASVVISRDNYKDIVWRLPADNLLFVNRGAMKIFRAMGIKTIGDIANTPVELLEKIFGKVGGYIHKYANGNDNSSVKHKDYVEPPKSIGNIETTYRDMVTEEDVRRVVHTLSENVASRLREQHYKCRTVKVYIREFDLKSYDRQRKLETPSFSADEIAKKAMEVFHTRYTFTKPLRSIGVRACDLVSDNVSIQRSLFFDAEHEEKKERLEKMIDDLRMRYGYDILENGIMMEDKKLTYIPSDYNRSSYRIGSFLGT